MQIKWEYRYVFVRGGYQIYIGVTCSDNFDNSSKAFNYLHVWTSASLKIKPEKGLKDTRFGDTSKANMAEPSLGVSESHKLENIQKKMHYRIRSLKVPVLIFCFNNKISSSIFDINSLSCA